MYGDGLDDVSVCRERELERVLNVREIDGKGREKIEVGLVVWKGGWPEKRVVWLVLGLSASLFTKMNKIMGERELKKKMRW